MLFLFHTAHSVLPPAPNPPAARFLGLAFAHPKRDVRLLLHVDAEACLVDHLEPKPLLALILVLSIQGRKGDVRANPP